MSSTKYRVGRCACADTIAEALEVRRAVFRVAGVASVPIVLRATGQIVTVKMARELRAEEEQGCQSTDQGA